MSEADIWDGDGDMFEDEEEKKHLFSVLDSFRSIFTLPFDTNPLTSDTVVPSQTIPPCCPLQRNSRPASAILCSSARAMGASSSAALLLP